MLDINRSKLVEHYVHRTHSAVSTIEEGSALVWQLDGGEGGLRPSVGGGNEGFAGVAVGRAATPTIVPYFENLVVRATGPYTVTLSKTMSGSSLSVVHVAAGGSRTKLTAGNPTNATEYSISNGVITVNSTLASEVIEVGYKYAISLQEAIMRYNFHQNGSHNVSDIGTIGVMNTGMAFTTMYDIGSNWASWTAATKVSITSDGLFTLSSSSTTATNCKVISVPSSEDSFLGLYISE